MRQFEKPKLWKMELVGKIRTQHPPPSKIANFGRACAPHGCSAPPGSAAGCMHRRPYYSPPFYRTPGKMKSNSGAVCASVWKISTIARIMTADRSVNTVHRDEFCFSWKSAGSWITLLLYCCVLRMTDNDRIR